MKVCIFGNSHASALKHGWLQIETEYPDVSIDMYSMPGPELGLLKLNGHSLSLARTRTEVLRRYPQTASRVIDLKSYDCFIMYALGFWLNPLSEKAYSRACRERATIDLVQRTVLWKLLRDIRKVTDASICVGPAPLLAATKILSKGAAVEYAPHLAFINENCFADRNITLVAQPEHTIVNGWKTDPKYNTNFIAFTKEKTEGAFDRKHMNPDFGAIMMREFLAQFPGT